MQLGHAVEGWIAAHDHALSPSTRQDIERIGTAIEDAGHASLPLSAVGEPHRRAIIAIAESRTSLSRAAIDEFLTIAVDWVRTAAPDPVTEALPSDTDGLIAADQDLAPAWSLDGGDTLGPRWADDEAVENDDAGRLTPDAATSVAEPSTNHPALGTPTAAVDEPDPVDDDAPEVDVHAIGRDATSADPIDDDSEPETDHLDEDVEPATAHGRLIDEDHLDADELATIDNDLDTGHDTSGEDTEAAVSDRPDDLDAGGAVFDDPAASSFLHVLGQSTAPTNVSDGERPERPAPAPAPDGLGGVFSEAAQYDGHERSVDWLTITYFVVAAICFGFVVYFYLSS